MSLEQANGPEPPGQASGELGQEWLPPPTVQSVELLRVPACPHKEQLMRSRGVCHGGARRRRHAVDGAPRGEGGVDGGEAEKRSHRWMCSTGTRAPPAGAQAKGSEPDVHEHATE